MTNEYAAPYRVKPEGAPGDNQTPTQNRNSVLNIPAQIHNLLSVLGESRVESVAYDTAWVARLGSIDRQLAGDALAWLRDHQLPDGAWGTLTPLYHHDRVICTLAAVIALVRNGAAEDQPRIRAALPALQFSLTRLHEDLAGRTIGFEMLLPTLVAEAKSLGLVVDDSNGLLHRMSGLRDLKLARAPRGLIDRHTTIGFSTEMAGPDGLHLLDVDNLQQADGSVSVSPAATAFFVANVRPDPAALRYLHRVVRNGGAPAVTSIDNFERAWTLWNFTRDHTIEPALFADGKALIEQLAANWNPERGIAYASIYSVQDSDVTGLVYQLLTQFGRAPDPTALWYYEEETHFRCYDTESGTSVSANIHILGGLREAGFSIDHPAVAKIAKFLQGEQNTRRFWIDKWHASPYYATSHAVIVCAGFLNKLVSDAVDWILQTQNSDGSWGYFAPTAEETAYCLQALLSWRKEGLPVPQEVLVRGAAWLAQHVEPPYTPQWIGKCLYCPTTVVRAAILAALRQYEREFGSLP